MIRRIIRAVDDDDQEMREALKGLKQMARKTPETLAPQLVYFGLHARGDQAAGTIVIIRLLAPFWELRRGMIPVLESVDARARKEAMIWLFNIDHAKSPVDFNLAPYRETLLTQKKTPPPGLVNYVYWASPSEALLLFGDIYSEQPKFGNRPRPLLWADHVVTTVRWRLFNGFLQERDLERARKELDTLSRHVGWYTRRYVVEILRGNLERDTSPATELGTPEIISRLKNDTNPLVREPAQSID